MRRWSLGTAVFFLIWILLSGQLNIKFLLIGFAVSGIVSMVCMPLFFDEDSGEFILRVSPAKLFFYFFWLVWQIGKSTVGLIPVVFFGKHRGEAQVFCFRCRLESRTARAFLISSIILTPGTVTVDIEKGQVYHVHALTEGAKLDLLGGEMQRRIGAIFGEGDVSVEEVFVGTEAAGVEVECKGSAEADEVRCESADESAERGALV